MVRPLKFPLKALWRGTTGPGKSGAQLPYVRRAFMVSLVGICTAISISYLGVSIALRTEIKSGMKESLERTEQSIERYRTRRNFRMPLVLEIVAADPTLIASMHQIDELRSSDGARLSAVKAIREHLEALRLVVKSELVAASDSHGRSIAALDGGDPAIERFAAGPDLAASGFRNVQGTLYDFATQFIQVKGRRLGSLTIGNRFRLTGLDVAPAALMFHGRLIQSTFPEAMNAQIRRRIDPACIHKGCEVRLGAEDFLVTPISRLMESNFPGDEYQLLGFRSINSAVDQILHRYWMLLPTITVCSILLAICLAALASRAVSRPIQQLVERLRRSEALGRLQPDFPENSPTLELNQLAASLNRAAAAVEVSAERLDHVHVEFIEIMAQTLDARDPYTAGHSNRVRDYAIAIAHAMQLTEEEIEIIGVGAQMHDIGKIGIPDAILQKAAQLSTDEFELIKLHPQIGRRIVQRVGNFEKYLPIIELHHENYDGSGYPSGLKGNEIPLAARIVRVADVFDALTTDRAYRPGMPAEKACQIIERSEGTHFDPDVVRALGAVLAPPGAETAVLPPLTQTALFVRP